MNLKTIAAEYSAKHKAFERGRPRQPYTSHARGTRPALRLNPAGNWRNGVKTDTSEGWGAVSHALKAALPSWHFQPALPGGDGFPWLLHVGPGS